jgi:GT2 family glycosyltransferase
MAVTSDANTPSASVVVVTLNRPSYLRTCLEHLANQTVKPIETVVVDASPDDLSYCLVTDEFPEVQYMRNPFGAGRTGMSRNLGLGEVSGDVIAFVDDDAYAAPDWLEQLLKPYEDPAVGGVGGRASNGIPGEEAVGTDNIGRLQPDGTLSGNFAADPGHAVDVDHFLGANMSFRRHALVELGGIRDGYPGTCLREETDLAFRVRSSGARLVYTPAARVEHVAAPYPKGRRFDIRYTYYSYRNHVVLLLRTLGPTSPELRRYLAVSGRESFRQLRRAAGALQGANRTDRGSVARTVAGGLSRASATGIGTLVGLGAGLKLRRTDSRSPSTSTDSR